MGLLDSVARFQYQAITHDGQSLHSGIEASTAAEARQLLRDQGLIPIKVDAVTIETAAARRWFKGYNTKELTLMIRQLATLVDARLSTDRVLLAVSQQTENRVLKQALLDVRQLVQEGYAMADAMSKVPQVFSPLFCASVEAGETAGHLNRVLNRLADHFERQYELKAKLTHALLYPTMMLSISILLTGFLLIFVVPKIVTMFQSQGQTLPWLTQIVIGASHFLEHHSIALIVALITSMFAYLRMLRSEGKWRQHYDTLLLRLPLIAHMVRLSNSSRYLNTLAMLTYAGVPIIQAMRMAAKVVPNRAISAVVRCAITAVNEGESIAQALQKTGCFAPMAIHLIANGEMSGELVEMLMRTADLQSKEMNRFIDTALTLSEPVMILLMGGIVLIIVLAVLLPIFDLEQLPM